MKSLCCVPLILGLLGFPAHPARADEEEMPLVPTWRFTADPENDHPISSSLGIYRRIGEAWDAGLYLSGGLSGSSDENTRIEDRSNYTRDTQEESTRQNGSVSLSLDVRRWRRRTDRLALFWGLRTTCGFSSTETNRTEESVRVDDEVEESWVDSDDTSEALSAAISALLGADLMIVRHLSIGIYFRPIIASGSWALSRSSSQGYDSVYQDLEDYSTKRRTRDGDYNVSFGLSPDLRLSLSF